MHKSEVIFLCTNKKSIDIKNTNNDIKNTNNYVLIKKN